MKRGCLSERRLLDWVNGEAASRDGDHVATCTLCAARAYALRGDLAWLASALRGSRPRSVARERARLRWLPIATAVAAAALGALVVQSWLRTPASLDRVAAQAWQQELAAAVFGASSGDTASASPYASVELAIGGASTCDLDDPFLGVGCEKSEVVSLDEF